MLKVKAGDTGKLGLLYERYKKRLYGFFYQMTQDSDLSEDLVQNVFMRILKYKHTFKSDGTFMTWVFQLARNVHSDHYKSNKRRGGQVDLNDVREIADQLDLQNELVEEEEKNQLNRALNYLPTHHREVLVLSKFKELRYREIGDVLGCSEVAARTKAHRALGELRNVFMSLSK